MEADTLASTNPLLAVCPPLHEPHILLMIQNHDVVNSLAYSIVHLHKPVRMLFCRTLHSLSLTK